MKFEEQARVYRETIERYLASIYASFGEEPQKPIFEAANYSLLAGGKRLRPMLALEFCRICGRNPEEALPFAAAVEMIHTYSLIHDDLPCMDNDDYRRGRLTNHKVFGEGMAVLAGDALLTDAFAVAARAKLPEPGKIGEAIAILSECAGSLGMIGGQVLDIMSAQRACTEQEVLDIQSRKTGRLIVAPCVLGVIAGNGTEAQKEGAAGFASLLGLAFQIRDDILDVIGDAGELGKATGVDGDKNTFVRLYGLSSCEQLVKDYTARAIDCLKVFPDPSFLTELALSLTERKN
ncbi:MAG: farnesyl diphosphate synthase [Candidatus Faecousia sp.]|nr:farnesyl diphosphate synthase [Candidatus Faecousia sp.]